LKKKKNIVNKTIEIKKPPLPTLRPKERERERELERV
jgi:hypothetical protein